MQANGYLRIKISEDRPAKRQCREVGDDCGDQRPPRIIRISLRAIDPLRYRPPRRVALHPNPRCNSLGQPMKHRAKIPFRYAPILALAPFSLLVADTFAEAL